MKRIQSGATLLEVLVALLLFAFGILGILGMHAVAAQLTGDAKYRAEAAMYVDQLISQMRADDPQNLVNDYASAPPGPKYVEWRNQIQAPGTGLPGSTGSNEPAVVFSADTSGVTNIVTVTILWQAPNETAPHQYVAVAQFLRN